MIIDNIEETRKTYLKDLKHYGKRVLIFTLTNNLITFLAALLFYYIEQCYDAVPQSTSYRESKFLEMCKRTNSINMTSSDSSNMSLETELQQWCQSDPTEDKVIECVLDSEALCKWTSYVITVQYTIGYGQVVTRSYAGRLMTMILMIPLIAINTTSYVYFGQMFQTLIKLLIIFIENRIMKFKTILLFQRKLIISHVLFSILFVLVYTLFAKATFLKHLSRFEILYLAFATFSTVGFGDVEFSTKQIQEHDGFGSVIVLQQVLFIGAFSMVASLITAISEAVSNKKKMKEEKEGQKQNKIQDKEECLDDNKNNLKIVQTLIVS